jgi:hypothetical protein
MQRIELDFLRHGPRSRWVPGVLLACALGLAGEVALRWSVFKAGFQSARDPRYTVEPQRGRVSQASPRGTQA